MLGNMSYIAKLFLWTLICVLIIVGIGAAIFIPAGNSLEVKDDIIVEVDNIRKSTESMLKNEAGIYDVLMSIENSAFTILKLAASNAGVLAGFIIAAILLYALYLFLTGLSYYPLAYVIRELMSSNTRYGFAASMAKNFKKAAEFSAVRMLISCPLDIAIVAAVAGIGFGLMKAIGVFVLPMLFVLAICLFTLRSMLYSGWLPRLLHHPDEGVFSSFARSLVSVKGNFGCLFKAFSMIFFVAYCWLFTLTVPTFGVINVLVPSMYYFLLRTVELVGYYKTNNMSFYIDKRTVINTVEYGYRKEVIDENQGEYNDINY